MESHPRQRPFIMVVDDHRAVREAVAQLIEENGMTVCAQAGSREEALTFALSAQPDLALVDLSLGNNDSLALVEGLHTLDIPVVVCSSYEAPEHVRRAIEMGARGYVAKREVGRVLMRTLRDVLEGWVLISPRAADGLTEWR